MRAKMLVLGSCCALVAACSSGPGTAGSTGPTGSGGTTATTSATTGSGGSSGGSGGSGGAGTGGGTTGAGGACAMDPTFAEILSKPLSGCAGFEPPCHNGGAGNLHIDPADANATWHVLVNVQADIKGAGKRVVPGDPGHSFLYRKLTNDLKPSEGAPMPKTGLAMGWPKLPDDEIEMVRCWILAGAKNN